MRALEMFGPFAATPMLAPRDGGSSDTKLQRRLAALAHASQEVNMLPVAETRAQWLRRAAEASSRQQADPRLLAK